MTNHCDTKAHAAFADDQFTTPPVAAGGEVVRHRLEASEVEWEITPGRRRGAWSSIARHSITRHRTSPCHFVADELAERVGFVGLYDHSAIECHQVAHRDRPGTRRARLRRDAETRDDAQVGSRTSHPRTQTQSAHRPVDHDA
jgi:hypothetical protein